MNIRKIELAKTSVIGKKIKYLKTIKSTHVYAKENINSIKENGIIVITDNQTNGIGTHGNTWKSSNNKNITMSIVLFPKVKVQQFSKYITIKVAQVMMKVIYKLYNIKLDIKFPNDLFLNGKKIGGILIETFILNEKIQKLIISIGFNVNEEQFNEISQLATSLKNEYNNIYSIEDIIVNFIEELEKILE